MKNSDLATWLEHCLEFVAQANDPLCETVFEVVTYTAATGSPAMMESVIGNIARDAAATGQDVITLLDAVSLTRQIIWERLEDEIDPIHVWDMLLSLEAIFDAMRKSISRNYTGVNTEEKHLSTSNSDHPDRKAEPDVIALATRLGRANRELATLEKAKTDFINIAAHELKTPLTLIKGYIDMILEQEGVLSMGNNLIITGISPNTFTGISAGVSRLDAIINDLIDVAAIEIGSLDVHPAPVAANHLIRVVVDQTREKTTTRKLEFEAQIEADLPVISTDTQRLHQILSQLLNNAIRYTPDGGKITVSARRETPTGNGDTPMFVKIEVADTGIGLSPEDRERIFDKFYRVGDSDLHSTGKEKFKGAGPGLGLSIAKGLVETLNGQIWAESPGHDEINCPGSTFCIRLPVD